MRIPSLHSNDPSLAITSPNETVPTAIVTIPAGLYPALKAGDTVIVGFEDDNTDKPIILGLLFSDSSYTTKADLSVSSAVVTVNVKLPEDTTIGKVTASNIKCLTGLKDNVQEKFNNYDDTLEAHRKYFKNIGNILGFTSDNLADADKQFKGPITLPQNCFGEELPKIAELGQIYFMLMDELEKDTVKNSVTSASQTSSDFTSILSRAGQSSNKLPSKCEQLITVESSSYKATVNSFEKKSGVWTKVDNVLNNNSAYVGSGGVGQASEYVKVTPQGLHPLGTAFGILDKPSGMNSNYDWFKVNNNHYWVSDPASKYYNQLVDISKTTLSDVTIAKSEHLIEYDPAYNYCVFIEYNSPPTGEAKGSAFFLHVATGAATYGCVSIHPDKMVEVLRWLDKDKNPYILIF